MKARQLSLMVFTALIAASFMTSGCALNLYKQSPKSRKKILELQSKVKDLEKERRKEQKEFAQVKRSLERKLKTQIGDKQVSLKMKEGSLVIVLSDDILFDSGKAEIKRQAYPVLDKVIRIIKREVPDKDISIGGHTDNVPITHSSWESNWELSTARATNVLHYMVDKGVSPDRLAATGYGEHHPIASNATDADRARNRRVEIAILPVYVEEGEEAEEKGEEEGFVK
ncbi:MAG: OmpA family protein [Candidatus Omnitrophota bacterium]